MKKECSNCFYEVDQYCRRYPPQAISLVDFQAVNSVSIAESTIITEFPEVKTNCWCGEWKDKATLIGSFNGLPVYTGQSND